MSTIRFNDFSVLDLSVSIRCLVLIGFEIVMAAAAVVCSGICASIQWSSSK